ncbi:hypothetical protein H8E77_24940 [bacterium]|nr:hypothetical protein [bacterium]
MTEKEIVQMVQKASQLHSIGGFSAQSTANGWWILLIQVMTELNENLTKMRYKLNENTRISEDILSLLSNIGDSKT